MNATNIKRECEAERDRDDESTNHDGNIIRGIAIQNVIHLARTAGHKPYRISAERHIASERVDAVHRENDDIRDEDDERHSLFGGLLHVAENGDELHLRAVAVAEHGQGEEDVSRDNEPLEVRFDRVRHACLAAFHAGAEAGAGGFFDVGFDDAGGVLADVVGLFGEGAGMDGDGLADHDEGEVDDAADREEGRVAESSDLLLERDREDDADRDEDENEFAAWRGEGKREHRTDQKGEGGRETVLEKVA